MFDFIESNQDLFKWILTGVFGVLLIVLFLLSLKYEKKGKNNSEKIKKMTAISILAAISVVLYYFVKISMNVFLPFIPGFLDIHFSNVPIYIGGFLFGPVSGIVISIIRFLTKLPASSTVGVGELADLIIAVATVMVSSIIYHHHKTKKMAIVALLSITFVWTITAIITNWAFLLDFYMYMYGFEAVLGMLSVVPGVTASNYLIRYVLIAVIPFNVILSILVSLITFVLYKRLSIIYKDIHIAPKKREEV